MNNELNFLRSEQSVFKYNTEEQFQAACVLWFDNSYPAWRKMLHANNNNSSDRISGNRNKATGVQKGASDLELVYFGGVAFIELKLPSGTQSDDQKEFERMVTERGHTYWIVYTLEQFKRLVWEIIGK